MINNHWIETYIRSPKWYDTIISSVGLKCVGYLSSGNIPPIGASKIKQSNWKSSKYYIAWYKKFEK